MIRLWGSTEYRQKWCTLQNKNTCILKTYAFETVFCCVIVIVVQLCLSPLYHLHVTHLFNKISSNDTGQSKFYRRYVSRSSTSVHFFTTHSVEKKYHPQKPWPISSTSIRIHWKTISFCNLGFLFSLLLQVWVHPSNYFLESAGQQSNACIQTSPYTCKMHFIFIVIFSIRMLRTCQKRGQVLQF